MTILSPSEVHPPPELIWVGDGAWVACDPTLHENDPHRVLAYVECRDHLVYVLWVRDHAGVVEFDTIREALQAIDEAAHPVG